jgi:hypothetical protein
MCVYDYRRCMHFVTGYIDHLYTPLITTSNHSTTANLQTLEFTIAPAKPFPACCVLTSRSLAKASNSGEYSASRSKVLSSPTLVQNYLPAISSGTLKPILCCSCQLPTAQITVCTVDAWIETCSLAEDKKVSPPLASSGDLRVANSIDYLLVTNTIFIELTVGGGKENRNYEEEVFMSASVYQLIAPWIVTSCSRFSRMPYIELTLSV